LGGRPQSWGGPKALDCLRHTLEQRQIGLKISSFAVLKQS
jgi:hypothetical protein